MNAFEFPFASDTSEFVSPTHSQHPQPFPRHVQYQPQPTSQPDNDTGLLQSQHYVEHWDHANPSNFAGHGNLANSAGSLSSTSWGMVSGMPSASNTPMHEKSSDSDDQEWVDVGLRSSHTASHSPLQKVESATSYSPPTFIPLQSPIQSTSEEKVASRLKLPKVASSFTQRAPKSKVCKRKGKMTDEGRAKAAEMRKNGPCIRCKLYKLGVCRYLPFYLAPC
jgi:hypothetical protein